jgi:hypothetical protein
MVTLRGQCTVCRTETEDRATVKSNDHLFHEQTDIGSYLQRQVIFNRAA